MNFQSNKFSVKRHFLSKVDSVKLLFFEKKIGHMTFWLNEFSVKWRSIDGDSVERTLGQMAFDQTVFGQMVFRSNDLFVKNIW
jgi:hypothetical protein